MDLTINWRPKFSISFQVDSKSVFSFVLGKGVICSYFKRNHKLYLMADIRARMSSLIYLQKYVGFLGAAQYWGCYCISFTEFFWHNSFNYSPT